MTTFRLTKDLVRKEAKYLRMRLEKLPEGNNVVDKEMERWLGQGFDLCRGIKWLELGKVKDQKDNRTKTPVVPPTQLCVRLGSS